MVKLKKFIFLLIFLVLVVFVKAQQPTFFNNGATIFCATGNQITTINGYNAIGSVLWVNGSLQNVGDSLYNLGNIYVSGEVGNINNEGDLINNGLISGDGKYHVAGHWINNGSFKCGISEVTFDNTPGNTAGLVTNQQINGSSHTTFYDLTFAGVGVKVLKLDDTIKHYLNLNDREYSLQSNTSFVTNTDPLAITRTTGFISNLQNGWLNRSTGVAGNYEFPMGSSGGIYSPQPGPTRYRPVVINTLSDTASQYIVGFYDYNASLDGYNVDKTDGSFCMVDSLYYHKINRVFGNHYVDMTIYFDRNTDGPWNGMANWRSTSTDWVNMLPVSMLFNPMWAVKKSNWSTWTDQPYALMAKTPDAVQINGQTEYCIGTGLISYIAYGQPTDSYIWTVTGGHIVGDSTQNTIQVLWTVPGTGILTVQVVQQWGECVGNLSHYNVTVYPQPIANFHIVSQDSLHLFTYDLIHFIDNSTVLAPSNIVQWHWDFGEGSPSNEQNPYHIYNNPGTYNVCLIVSSQHDCTNDTCKEVIVIEGIQIPNVFTPNGDGKNDFFDIRASGMTQFHLQIYNRWGALLFESESPSVKWDGRTLSGEQADDGTYFYILNAKSESKDYSNHGYITLLR